MGKPLGSGGSWPPGNCDSLISHSLPVGHGQSEGERMVVSDFHVFIRDVLQHVDIMQKDYPGLPVFLLGHSMVSRPQKTPPESSPVPSLAVGGRSETPVMKTRCSPPHLLSFWLPPPPRVPCTWSSRAFSHSGQARFSVLETVQEGASH